jgi:hypothetical protein
MTERSRYDAQLLPRCRDPSAAIAINGKGLVDLEQTTSPTLQPTLSNSLRMAGIGAV